MPCLSNVFQEHSIASAYKAGNYAQAKTNLEEVLINNPYDVQTITNLAKVFYQQKDFKTAATYFSKAIESPSIDVSHKEEIYVDLGNAFVQLKKLQEALDAYEQALTINLNNTKARHNYDIVKKMLEEQKQKEQEKNQSQQQDKQQDKQKEQNQQQSQKDNQDKDSQDNKAERGNQDSPQPQESSGGNSQEATDKGDNKSDSNNNKDDAQRQGSNKDKHSNNRNQQQQQNNAQHEKTPLEKNKEQQNNHKKPDLQKQENEGALQKDLFDDKNDQGVDTQLNDQEQSIMAFLAQQDKAVNKQMLKTTMGARGTAYDETHNW